MGQSKFTISLLGFDDRSATMLGQATSRTMRIVDPINEGETQVVVVDIDGSGGSTIWSDFRKQWPHMPAVVVCSDDPDFDDASFAEKPFTAESLIDNITEAIILSPSEEDIATNNNETIPDSEIIELSPASDNEVEIEDWSIHDETVSPEEIDTITEAIILPPSEEDIATDNKNTIPDSEIDTEAWFGHDETASSDELAHDMDKLSLELTASDAKDYLSEETVSPESSETMPENQAAEFHIDAQVSDTSTESELKVTTLPDDIDVEMDEFQPESNSTTEIVTDPEPKESTPSEEFDNEMDKLFHEAMASASKQPTSEESPTETEGLHEPIEQEPKESTPSEEFDNEMDKLFHEAMASAPKQPTSEESPTEIEGLQAFTEPEQENSVVKISTVDEISAADTPAAENETRPLSEIASILTSRSSITSELPSRALDSPNPEETFFNPDAHMIGLVLKGVAEGNKSGSIAKLACLLDRTIYIDARNKIISSNLKDIHMRQIAIAPLGKGENGLDTQLEMLDSTSLDNLSSSEGSIYPMETFIWELALLTSKGRVPIGTPMDKPTYLMQWPNFPQLMQVPNDMKIAAYWLRLPSSLTDLSENLNVPIDNVRLMYSASFLTGIAGIATRKSDHMLRPGKPEEHENRNLFGSFMNKFKK